MCTCTYYVRTCMCALLGSVQNIFCHLLTELYLYTQIIDQGDIDYLELLARRTQVSHVSTSHPSHIFL